jgi:hypothetical protein
MCQSKETVVSLATVLQHQHGITLLFNPLCLPGTAYDM